MATRKMYSGHAVATRLTGDLGSGITTFSVSDATGYPDGSDGPFVVTIDRGLATQEALLITSRSGTLFTVADRGYDGTTDVFHATSAVVEHTLDAVSIDEANELAASYTTKGDIGVRTSSAVVRLPVGPDGYVLTARSASTPGVAWLEPHPILCPIFFLGAPGDVPATHLALTGQEIPDASYPQLTDAIKAIGSPWNTGGETANYTRLPTMVAKSPLGIDPSDSALDEEYGTAGAKTTTLTSGHLPAHSHNMDHTHSIAHDHQAKTSAGGSPHHHSASHDHEAASTDPGGTHHHLSSSGTNFFREVTSGTGSVRWFSGGDQIWAVGSGTDDAPNHSHTFNVPGWEGTTADESAHTHSVNLDGYTGDSGPSSNANTSNNVTVNNAFSRYHLVQLGVWIVRAA